MARQKRGRKIDGWLILDKPQGITSTQAVNKVKRALDAQNVERVLIKGEAPLYRAN